MSDQIFQESNSVSSDALKRYPSVNFEKHEIALEAVADNRADLASPGKSVEVYHEFNADVRRVKHCWLIPRHANMARY